jgi:WD40 repeat protein
MVASSHLARKPITLLSAFAFALLASCRPGVPATLLPLMPSPSPPILRPTSLPIPEPTSTIMPSPTTAIAPTAQVALSRETIIDGARALAWSPDGKRIALTTLDGVVLVDAGTLQEVASATTTAAQDALAFSDDGAKLVTADYGRDRREFRLWNAEDLSLVWTKDLPSSLDYIDVANLLVPQQDGGFLLATSSLIGADIWHIAIDGAMDRVLQMGGVITETATIDPSLGLVAVYMGPGGPEQNVQFWNLTTGAIDQELPYPGVFELEFASRRGVLLVAAHSVFIWDIDQGKELASVRTSTGLATGLGVWGRITVGVDDILFATGTELPARGIGIWETDTGVLVAFLPENTQQRTAGLALSPTARELAVLGDDDQLHVWEIP